MCMWGSCAQMGHKSRLCHFFSKGFCKSGDACRFAHGPAELQTASASWRSPGPSTGEPRLGRGAGGRGRGRGLNPPDVQGGGGGGVANCINPTESAWKFLWYTVRVSTSELKDPRAAFKFVEVRIVAMSMYS